MRRLTLILGWLLAGTTAWAQEPQTREEVLRAQRAEKAQHLSPPESSGTERLLIALEEGRLFERVLNPAEGWYPKLGNVTAGSGFSFGPGYRRPGLAGGQVDASAFAIGSFKQYWMLEGRLRLPRLASNRLLVDVHAQRFEYPKETFFGPGPDSRRQDEVVYGYRSSVLGATVGFKPHTWVMVSGGVDWLNPDVTAGAEAGDIRSLFSDADAPGLTEQPDFFRYDASIEFNSRDPRPNPKKGGLYRLTYQRYDDRGTGDFSFDRVEADLQHYIPFLNDRRVIALHAFASTADAGDRGQVPFYFQRTLGGPDDLRGFRRFRFRDTSMLLMQAEYRWEIFTAVDGAVFYDVGKVASDVDALDFHRLESNYGIGFRFGSNTGVFLRVEGAFGSSGGAHFVMRFGNAF